jgi:hypothetical protein
VIVKLSGHRGGIGHRLTLWPPASLLTP